MNHLMKPAFIAFSNSAKSVIAEESILATKKEQERQLEIQGIGPMKERANEFLQGKLFTKPMPGSILAGLDKRLELVEVGGEIARLELLLSRLRKSGKYSSFELHSLSSKIILLKENLKEKMI